MFICIKYVFSTPLPTKKLYCDFLSWKISYKFFTITPINIDIFKKQTIILLIKSQPRTSFLQQLLKKMKNKLTEMKSVFIAKYIIITLISSNWNKNLSDEWLKLCYDSKQKLLIIYKRRNK